MTKIQSLNGVWNYRIGKGKKCEIKVPFSCLPVGHSECDRCFDLKFSSDKVYLCFDGITYAAKVYLNSCLLSDMLPYCKYSFDISDIVKEKDNCLLVELEDINADFGPTAGWENFGGIIRDVTLQYKCENHIEDVFAHYTLTDNYSTAILKAETKCTVLKDSVFNIKLFYKDKIVSEYTQSASEKFIEQKIENIILWSPDDPQLYKLEVTLLHGGKVCDTYCCNIGFREISCDKHRFKINGKYEFLKGVCKHEMYGDSGHCPNEAQIRDDLQKIKSTGCNFVRLVHYPHSDKTLDIADEIGLLVSEEPGLWWSDTSDPKVANGSIEILRRTIIRDRNHPCVAFWLCFNECKFTESFLIESAKVCKETDPTRMVSGANCMSNEDTLKYYNLCGFDFYTMHPYAQTFERAAKSAKILNDKPLVFTEWGGHFVYNNPKLFSEFLNEMNKLYMSAELAGSCFWFWAELNDFNRSDASVIDGHLYEGLVDKYRNPTMIYDAFCEGIKKIGKAKPKYPFWYEPKVKLNGKNLLSENQSGGFQEFIKNYCEEPSMRMRKIIDGPVLQNISPLNNIPLLIKDSSEIKIGCDMATDKLSIVGLACFGKGYPLSSEYGEDVALLEIAYQNGKKQSHTFKNGIDVTTVFTTKWSSQINPIAEDAETFAYFGYDKNFEKYVINCKEIKTSRSSPIKEITIRSKGNGYALLLYGIIY